jgi:prophage regulatory protein
MNESGTQKLPQMLRLKQVCARIGLSRSSVYEKLSPTSKWHDATFPRPVKLGVKAVGWNEAAVSDWLTRRIKATGQQAN